MITMKTIVPPVVRWWFLPTSQPAAVREKEQATEKYDTKLGLKASFQGTSPSQEVRGTKVEQRYLPVFL